MGEDFSEREAIPARRRSSQENPRGEKKAADPMHLLSLRETTRDDIRAIITDARARTSDADRGEAIRKTVALALFDDEAPTRLLLEQACRRLGAEVLTLPVRGDDAVAATARTARSLGADVLALRHPRAGAPWVAARHFGGPVLNAGDGANENPPRALLDLAMLDEQLPRLDGARVAIIGGIGRSATGRSMLWGLRTLGAAVTLVGPPTMVPAQLTDEHVTITHDLDATLPNVDALYVLPLATDGPARCLFPSVDEYVRLFGIDPSRLSRAPRPLPVLHPGPLGREVSGALGLSALRDRQLRDGIALYASILSWLLKGRPDAMAA